MLQILQDKANQVVPVTSLEGEALWYDLISPDLSEMEMVEKAVGVHIPTLAEMSEIEESSRLYEENGALYMTSLLLASADSDHPKNVPVTFIVTSKALVTVRYDQLKPFEKFAKQIPKNDPKDLGGVFWGLMDAIIERVADILESNAMEIDGLSTEIFKAKHPSTQRQLNEVLNHIGRTGNINSKTRESLATLDRQLIFYHDRLPEKGGNGQLKIQTLQHDVRSLVDYVSFLFSKIDFLLNATLGFIDIEQNGIIKFFSIAAVIFLPPMVIASIYGMNFAQIPELKWVWGYPFALFLMILSGVLPYYYFKRKGWL